MPILWTVLTIASIIIEAATVNFVSIWFAGGAFAALICSLFDIGVWIEAAVFVVVTIVLLIATKPFVKKLTSATTEKTNVDSLIGKTAIVTEKICNNNSEGAVKIDGKIWSSRSLSDEDIEAGTAVTVEKIDGVKLIVKIK